MAKVILCFIQFLVSATFQMLPQKAFVDELSLKDRIRIQDKMTNATDQIKMKRICNGDGKKSRIRFSK